MNGSAGDDWLVANDGVVDTLDGGEDNDTAEADSGLDLTINVEVLA
jgi:hypothetical protein